MTSPSALLLESKVSGSIEGKSAVPSSVGIVVRIEECGGGDTVWDHLLIKKGRESA